MNWHKCWSVTTHLLSFEKHVSLFWKISCKVAPICISRWMDGRILIWETLCNIAHVRVATIGDMLQQIVYDPLSIKDVLFSTDHGPSTSWTPTYSNRCTISEAMKTSPMHLLFSEKASSDLPMRKRRHIRPWTIVFAWLLCCLSMHVSSLKHSRYCNYHPCRQLARWSMEYKRIIKNGFVLFDNKYDSWCSSLITNIIAEAATPALKK